MISANFEDMKKVKTLILFLLLSQLAVANTFYISTKGKEGNNGTKEHPLPFKYLEQKKNHAGDVFIVLEGRYPGHWITEIYGTEQNPVIIKSESWLAADLVGTKGDGVRQRKILTINGHYSWFQGFEIYDDEAKNRIKNNGADYYFSDGVHQYGKGSKVINCVAHDVIIGFSSWSTAIGGEIYGCIAYNIGYNDMDSGRANKGHGHGFYVQNRKGHQVYKKLQLNIVWGTASEGFQCYTQKGNIEYFDFESNLAFNLIGLNQTQKKGRGYILGGYKPLTALKFVGNHTYKTSAQFGYGTFVPNITYGASISNNYFSYSRITIYEFHDMIDFGNNHIITNKEIFFAYQAKEEVQKTWDWPFKNNIIYTPKGEDYSKVGIQRRGVGGTVYLAIKDSPWKKLNNTMFSERPKSRAFVYKNKHDSTRANVYIYNYGWKDNFRISLKQFAKAGDLIEIRDVENINKVLYKGKYDGKVMSFPMNSSTLAKASGNIPFAHAKHTPKEFNAFVIFNKSK